MKGRMVLMLFSVEFIDLRKCILAVWSLHVDVCMMRSFESGGCFDSHTSITDALFSQGLTRLTKNSRERQKLFLIWFGSLCIISKDAEWQWVMKLSEIDFATFYTICSGSSYGNKVYRRIYKRLHNWYIHNNRIGRWRGYSPGHLVERPSIVFLRTD